MENLNSVTEELKDRANSADNPKLKMWMNKAIALLNEMQARGVSPKDIDPELKVLRRQLDGDTRYEQIRSFYGMLLDYCRKKLNLVPPKYYQNQWMGLGMMIFGIPFGFMFSSSFDNFAFIGIGLPIGLSLGIAIGTEKDKKAKAEGRQLNI